MNTILGSNMYKNCILPIVMTTAKMYNLLSRD